MIYLSGHVGDTLPMEVGFMVQPRMGNLVDLSARSWAADNGCYSQGDRFQLELYLGWLQRQRPHLATCLFATAPDVLGDAAATLARSTPVLPLIRELGYPAALVGQDGLVDPPWETFDAFFIGGTTAWKMSMDAFRLTREARRRGKWCHMGRVNSYRRLRLAELFGCHSADGTILKYGPTTNLPRVMRWLGLERDLPLWETA